MKKVTEVIMLEIQKLRYKYWTKTNNNISVKVDDLFSIEKYNFELMRSIDQTDPSS